MLNPKIVEVYGEESRNAFYELINEMGKDLASTCYVITRCPYDSRWCTYTKRNIVSSR